MNGVYENRGETPQQQASAKLVRNYKLLSDPFINKGGAKIYRYDGIVPDPTFPPVIPRDPRLQISRLRTRLEPMELIFPK